MQSYKFGRVWSGKKKTNEYLLLDFSNNSRKNVIIIISINEIFVMRLSKQTPQKRIADDYIDLKSSVLSSFLKAVKVHV